MIIAGDIAVPSLYYCQGLREVLTTYSNVFYNKTLICNFEGLLKESIVKSNEPVLNNHPSVLELLKERGDVVLCLANNHVLDLSESFAETINAAQKHKIFVLGAGNSIEESEKPAVFFENGRKVIVYNACWDFLLYNHRNPSNNVYVSVINEKKLIENIAKCRIINSGASIVVFLHWNFDLEYLPFPMHRQFARDLIDGGADLVVGTHSHCIQGGEQYKHGFIVYGLGNFYIPNNEFASGNLRFPQYANNELVLEWDAINERTICHWFETPEVESKPNLLYVGQENFVESEKLLSYSPFRGMSDDEYLGYFTKFRRKKLFIPVYEDYRKQKTNYMKTFFLKKRAYIGRTLAKIKIINWER